MNAWRRYCSMVVSDSLIDLVHFRCCLLLVVTHLTTGMARKERKKVWTRIGSIFGRTIDCRMDPQFAFTKRQPRLRSGSATIGNVCTRTLPFLFFRFSDIGIFPEFWLKSISAYFFVDGTFYFLPRCPFAIWYVMPRSYSGLSMHWC